MVARGWGGASSQERSDGVYGQGGRGCRSDLRPPPGVGIKDPTPPVTDWTETPTSLGGATLGAHVGSRPASEPPEPVPEPRRLVGRARPASASDQRKFPSTTLVFES